ncbi:MAG: hypothetical protein WD512_04635, partial [Candidatus Paceibacterota bacterium]
MSSTEAGCLTFNGSIENLYSLYLKLDMLKTITDELSEADAEKVNYVYDLLDTSFPFLRMIKMSQSQQEDTEDDTEDDSDEKDDEKDDDTEDDKDDEKEENKDENKWQTKEEMQAYYLAKLQAIMDEQEQADAQAQTHTQAQAQAQTLPPSLPHSKSTEKKALKEPKVKVPK